MANGIPSFAGPVPWWRTLTAWFFSSFLRTEGAPPPSPSSVCAAQENARNQKAVELLDTYGNSVLRCAYAYLHNLSDAEEILQETLIRYLETSPALESADHEKAWLLRVAANLSKNKLRYNQLRATDELSERIAAQKREDLSFVWEAVKSLPVHERSAIHLFYLEGYSTQEIASILQRKESTIRSDLRRGRLHLKAILKEGYDFA